MVWRNATERESGFSALALASLSFPRERGSGRRVGQGAVPWRDWGFCATGQRYIHEMTPRK